MRGGDLVGFGVESFTHRDLEVGIHSVADVPIGRTLIGFCIPFDSRLKPLDFVLKGDDREAMDLFAVLDGLDQTGCDISEGAGIDSGISGEYSFHSMGRIARWERCGTTSVWGFGRGIDGIV